MAAILCQKISQLVQGCSDAIGGACDSCIGGCTRACTHSCNSCKYVCKTGCSKFKHFMKHYFSMYVVIVTVLNLGGVWNFTLVLSGTPSCHGWNWLLINAIFALVHIVAAFYMYIITTPDYYVHDDDDDDEEKPGDNEAVALLGDQATTGFDRMKYLLCHDEWMAGYILVVLFYIFWLWTGTFELLVGEISSEEEHCPEHIVRRVFWAVLHGYGFLFSATSALIVSVIRAYCCHSTSERPTTATATPIATATAETTTYGAVPEAKATVY